MQYQEERIDDSEGSLLIQYNTCYNVWVTFEPKYRYNGNIVLAVLSNLKQSGAGP